MKDTPHERLKAAKRQCDDVRDKKSQLAGCAELQRLMQDPEVGDEARQFFVKYCIPLEAEDAREVRILRGKWRDLQRASIYDKDLPQFLLDLNEVVAGNLCGAPALLHDAAYVLSRILTAATGRLAGLSNFGETCRRLKKVAAITPALRTLDEAMPLAAWQDAASAALEKTAEIAIDKMVDCGDFDEACGLVRRVRGFEPGFDVTEVADRLVQRIDDARKLQQRLAEALARLRHPPSTWEEARAWDAALAEVRAAEQDDRHARWLSAMEDDGPPAGGEEELTAFMDATARDCRDPDALQAWWREAAALRPEVAEAVPAEAFTVALEGWQETLAASLRAAQTDTVLSRVQSELEACDDQLPPPVRDWVRPRARAIGAIASVLSADWVLSSAPPADLDVLRLPVPPAAGPRLAAVRDLQALHAALDDAEPADELALYAAVEREVSRLQACCGPAPELAVVGQKATERLFARHALPALARGRIAEFRKSASAAKPLDLSSPAWDELAAVLAAAAPADVPGGLRLLARLADVERTLAAAAGSLGELRRLLDRERQHRQRQLVEAFASARSDAGADPSGPLAQADQLAGVLAGPSAEAELREVRGLHRDLLKRAAGRAVAAGDADELRRRLAELTAAGGGPGELAALKFALDLLDAERLDDAALRTWLWNRLGILERMPADRVGMAVLRVGRAFAGDPLAERATQCAELVQTALDTGRTRTDKAVENALHDLQRWFALRVAGESGDAAAVRKTLAAFLHPLDLPDLTPFRAALERWATTVSDPWVRCVLHHAGHRFAPPLFIDPADPLNRLRADARTEADRLDRLYRGNATALDGLDGDIERCEKLYGQWLDLEALLDDPDVPRIVPPKRLRDVLDTLHDMRQLRSSLEELAAADFREEAPVRRLEAAAGELRQRSPGVAALEPLRKRAQQLTAVRGLPLAWRNCRKALDRCSVLPVGHGRDHAFAEAAAHVEGVRAMLASAGLEMSPCAAATLIDIRVRLGALVADAGTAEGADLSACRAALLALDEEETAVYRWLSKLEALRPPVPEGAKLYPSDPRHKRLLDALLEHAQPRARRTRVLVARFLHSREYACLQDTDQVPPWINEKR